MTSSDGLIVSIGICAWNEEKWIARTLESLLLQDIFSVDNSRFKLVEIIVLANACTDQTAEISRVIFDRASVQLPKNRFHFSVIETTEGGLARSINTITHELSHPDADYLVKLDSDITFDSSTVLGALIDALEQNSNAEVCRPILKKHIAKKNRRSPLDLFSLFASRYRQEKRWWVDLSGPCYCGRARALRRIWEPIGLRGTDVYVRDMIVTDNWRSPDDRRDERIILVSSVSVSFITYASIRAMLYHQTRHQMALAMRLVLHEFLTENVGSEGAGELIARLNEQNTEWFHDLLHSRLCHDQFWIIPQPLFSTNELRHLLHGPFRKTVIRLIPVVLMEGVYAYARFRANMLFKKRAEGSVWRLPR